MLVNLPESRIFEVGMTISAFLFLIFGYIRDRIIQKASERHFPRKTIAFTVLINLMRVALVVGTLAMSLLSCNPVKIRRNAHNFFAGTFFGSMFFYFVFGDHLVPIVGIPVGCFSRILSYLMIVCATCVMIIRRWGAAYFPWKKIYTVGSVLEYLAVIGQMIKFFIIMNELPEHSLKVSLKNKNI